MTFISNERLLRSENIVYDEQFVWTKLSWFNDILEINQLTGESKVIPLPDEYSDLIWAYRSINKKDRVIFVIPFKARDLLIYNLDEDKYDKIALPDNLFKSNETDGFTMSVVIGDYLIMFGYYPLFLFFHIPSKKFEIVDGIKEKFDKDFHPTAWMSSWVEKDGKIYVHIFSSNAVLVLDVKNKSIDVIKIKEFDHIDGVVGIDNGGLIIPIFEEKDVLMVRYKQNGDCIINTIPYGMVHGIRPFSWMVNIKNQIFFVPGSLPMAIKYDLISGNIEQERMVPNVTYEYMSERKTEFPINYYAHVEMGNNIYCTDDNKIIIIHPWSAKLVIIDGDKEKVDSVYIDLDIKSIARINKEKLKQEKGANYSKIYKEEKGLYEGLKSFISILLDSDSGEGE